MSRIIELFKSMMDMVDTTEEFTFSHQDYYTTYFYAPADNRLSTKRRASVWCTDPSYYRRKGIPVVRTSVRLDRRLYDAKRSSVYGFIIKLEGGMHKHFSRTAKKVITNQKVAA